MISLTCGVTGSGKTYSSIVFMAKQLEFTKRLVITQIQEIDLGLWQKFLDERSVYKKSVGFRSLWNDDITQRVFVVPRSDTSHYYRFRGWKTFEPFRSVRGRSIEDTDRALEAYFAEFDQPGKPGVVYVMDELHRHFRSDRWEEISEAVNFHLAQHRHLDDEFWGISQNPEQIAVRFNRQVHECHVWRNHYKESFGLFGKPGCFYRRSYYFVPKTGNQAAVPYEEGKLYLDPLGYGKLYRTRGALGGMNVTPEKELRKFKLPWWSIIFFAVGFVALVGWGLISLPKLYEPLLRSFITNGGQGVKTIVGGAKPLVPVRPSGSVKVAPEAPVGLPVAKPKIWASDRRVVGLVHDKSRFSVYLSDGSKFTEETGEVRTVGRFGVLLWSGESIPYAARVVGGAPPQSAPSGAGAERRP